MEKRIALPIGLLVLTGRVISTCYHPDTPLQTDRSDLEDQYQTKCVSTRSDAGFRGPIGGLQWSRG